MTLILDIFLCSSMYEVILLCSKHFKQICKIEIETHTTYRLHKQIRVVNNKFSKLVIYCKH